MLSRKWKIASLFVIAFSMGLGIGLWGSAALRAQPASPQLTALLRTELPCVPNQEAMVQVVDIPPGLVTPKHTHPNGHEITYLLSGEGMVEIDGDARPLKMGELFHVPPDVPHEGRNTSATQALRLLVVSIRDRQAPIMLPVK